LISFVFSLSLFNPVPISKLSLILIPLWDDDSLRQWAMSCYPWMHVTLKSNVMSNGGVVHRTTNCQPR
jgi:hypothetical protein